MATVTSLPELVTGLSAVTIAAAPNLAVGDALGSCVFSLAILAVVDVVRRTESFYAEATEPSGGWARSLVPMSLTSYSPN